MFRVMNRVRNRVRVRVRRIGFRQNGIRRNGAEPCKRSFHLVQGINVELALIISLMNENLKLSSRFIFSFCSMSCRTDE